MAATGKGARTRQRILRAAATILAEQGVTATNLSDVVQTAHITKGALYFHFASKDELILGVESEYHADSRRMVAEIEHEPDAVRRLVLLSFALGRRQLKDSLAQAHSRLLLARVAPPLQKLLPFPPIDWVAVIDGWLDEAERAGQLRPGLDRPEVSELIDDCFVGAVTAAQVEFRRVGLLERVSALWRLFLLPALLVDGRHHAEMERLLEQEVTRGPDLDTDADLDASPAAPAAVQPLRKASAPAGVG